MTTESIAGAMCFLGALIVMPIVVLGLIRKIKARFQNRVGPPLLQPFFDIALLFRKRETVSDVTSWVFHGSAALILAVMLIQAVLIPWLSFKPAVPGADLILVLYLFALSKLALIFFAFDSASPFGAFGASREVTLSLLVEPASMLSLAALAIQSQSTDLSRIFAYGANGLHEPVLWCIAGMCLLLASLVELSRMPVDDPTTHLELTMVHEAMILEASGPTLAVNELSHAIHMTILFGLVGQCFIHAVVGATAISPPVLAALSVGCTFIIAALVAVFESVAVRVHWRKAPEFIAYAVTFGLFACLFVIAGSHQP